MDLLSTDLLRILSRPWASLSPSLSISELAPSARPSVSLALSHVRALRPSFPLFLFCWTAVYHLPPSHAYLPLHLSASPLHTLSSLRQPCPHDRVHPYNFPYPHLPCASSVPSRAFSLFIPRFHGTTQRSAHDEQQRGPFVLVTFLKSSSRMPTRAHDTHRGISIASRALTIGRRSVRSRSSSATLDETVS